RQTGKHGFERLVAVKTILPKYADQPRFQRMFVDEARIASRIQHVNVAQTLDVGEQHGITYLVMEYVDGDALSKIYRAVEGKGAGIPLGVLLRIMADACGGIHAAHELRDGDNQPLGVVHRDVSPQNILVSTSGVARLIDFGIAKARDRLAGDTNTDQLKGKVQYMAPEQAMGRPTDRRADVWSLGAVLYHVLAGRAPFEGDNDVQAIFRLASGRPPLPLPPRVHPAVAAVVARTLLHDPDRRYATAAELQQAIEMAMIEAEVPTTTVSVAAWLDKVMGDRAKRRKETIALGLRAAEERDKYSAAMRSRADQSGDSASLMSSIEPPSGATLGSTAVTVAHLSRPRRPVLGIASALVGVGIGVAGVVMMFMSRSSSPPPIVVAAPPPAVVALPEPSVTADATASAAPPSPASATAPAPPPSPVRFPHIVPVRARPSGGPKPRVNDGF
ncbi:MAG TPA: serine/threonine-protein kinase, partial [Polyangiaceae bacterium]